MGKEDNVNGGPSRRRRSARSLSDSRTWSDDDGGGLVVDGHGPVVGRHREPAAHLVEPPVHHGSVVGINLDSFFQHFQRQSLCTFRD